MKLQVELGDDADIGKLYETTYLITNELAYPILVHKKAKKRRQIYRLSKQRGTKWEPPQFDYDLYKLFKTPNPYIDKLFAEANKTSDIARKTRSSIKVCDCSVNNNDDGYAYNEMDNEEDSALMRALTKSMRNQSISPIRPTSRRCSKYKAVATVDEVDEAEEDKSPRLAFGASGNPCNLVVLFGAATRTSDNGKYKSKTILMKADLPSPLDGDKVR